MAQEGIATLPQAPEDVPMMASPDDDLGLTKNAVMQQLGPEAMGSYEQTMDQVVSSLNLSIEDLQTLLEALQVLLQNEQQYPQLRQRLIQEAGLDPEDIPEEFDRGYLTTMVIFAKEAIRRNQGNGAQMPQPQGFALGGLAGAAESLRQQGRGGDTILAHINPQEAGILKAMGGSGTINPATGLPEYFKIGNPFKSIGNAFKSVGNAVKTVVSSPVGKIIATVALAAVLGPGVAAIGLPGLGLSTALAAGLAGTAISLAGGSNLNSALKTGVISGAMAGFAPEISKLLPGAGGYLNAAATGAIMGAGYGAATGQNIGQAAVTGGVLAGGMSAAGGASATGPSAENPGLFSNQAREPAPVTDRSAPLSPAGGISNLPNAPTPPSNVNNYVPGNAITEIKVEPLSQVNPNQVNPNQVNPRLASGLETVSNPPNQVPNQVPTESTGVGGLFNKAKDSLFSSDPKDPGFFYNKQGNISIPAVTGTVLAGGALMGGFTPKEQPPPGIVDPKVTGETLISRNPSAYIVGGLPGYNAPIINPMTPNFAASPQYGRVPVYAARGGITSLYPRKTGEISGPGTETSDSIPAMLSDGEFVLTAKAVKGVGNGSRREGAKKLYRMMHSLEKKVGARNA